MAETEEVMWWTELADDELKDRLWHKLNDDPFALPLIRNLVNFRDEDECIADITRLLN